VQDTEAPAIWQWLTVLNPGEVAEELAIFFAQPPMVRSLLLNLTPEDFTNTLTTRDRISSLVTSDIRLASFTRQFLRQAPVLPLPLEIEPRSA
jgi:hypothetical protein